MPSWRNWLNGAARKREATGRHAFLVAAGILLSRLFGLVRQARFQPLFRRESDAADAFNAAFRIPNFLQTLFGEGVLSASFIPVYARLLSQGDEEEAGRVAGRGGRDLGARGIAASCCWACSRRRCSLTAIAPGFHGESASSTIRLVRILFPGAGCLVHVARGASGFSTATASSSCRTARRWCGTSR